MHPMLIFTVQLLWWIKSQVWKPPWYLEQGSWNEATWRGHFFWKSFSTFVFRLLSHVGINMRTNSEEIGNGGKDRTWGLEFDSYKSAQISMLYQGQWVWGYLLNYTQCNQDTDFYLEWTWHELSSRHWEDMVYSQHQKHVKSKRLLRSFYVYAQRWLPARVTSHLTSQQGRVRSHKSLQNIVDLRLASSKLLFFCFFLKLGLQHGRAAKIERRQQDKRKYTCHCGLISVLVLVNMFFSLQPSSRLFPAQDFNAFWVGYKESKKDFKTDDIELSMYFYCVGARNPSKLCRGWRLWGFVL